MQLRSPRKTIARIGMERLYMEDVAKLLPPEISPEDSAAMVQQYINTWALSHLMYIKANEELSKEQKDISKEVEDYSKSLLNFRYEKSYVESKLDTTVTQNDIAQYYNEHPDSFIYNIPIFKVRIITISNHSPYFADIKKNYNTTDEEKLAELDSLAHTYAEQFETFDDMWIPLQMLARATATDVESCQLLFAESKTAALNKKDEKTQFVYITDRIKAGEVTPIEYNQEKIKESILSKRKHDLLSSLERALLEQALTDKKLKLYDND